jgi:hypothetical protein
MLPCCIPGHSVCDRARRLQLPSSQIACSTYSISACAISAIGARTLVQMQNVNKTEQSSMTRRTETGPGPCVRDHCASDLEGKVVVMLRFTSAGATAPCTRLSLRLLAFCPRPEAQSASQPVLTLNLHPTDRRLLRCERICIASLARPGWHTSFLDGIVV